MSVCTSLIIGDPHFKISNVKETNAMTESICQIAKDKNLDFIVVLGDVLDRHETIHVSPLTRSINFLRRLYEIAPTYVLIGNHDLKNNRQFLSDEHGFNALKSWGDNMTIVDTTVKVTIKDNTFVFVPYVPPGRFLEALSTIDDWKDATCIFAHQEFKGAKMGAITSVEGDEWSTEYPYVITGHIHDYQEINNILYVGTPIQHSYGDTHKKTISLMTFNGLHRDHTRLKLNVPKKKIIKIKYSQVGELILKSGYEYKIIIRGTAGELKGIMKHPNILTWKKQGYKVVYDTISSAISENTIVRPVLSYGRLLYSSVEQDKDLKDIYNSLFGEVNSLDLNKLYI